MAQNGTNSSFFFSNMYETLNECKYFSFFLHFSNHTSHAILKGFQSSA